MAGHQGITDCIIGNFTRGQVVSFSCFKGAEHKKQTKKKDFNCDTIKCFGVKIKSQEWDIL